MMLDYGWVIFCVCLVCAVICCIVKAKALRRISKCNLLTMGWLAWLPCGKYWVLGNIADDFRAAEEGKKSIWRWVLLFVTFMRNVFLVFYVFVCYIFALCTGVFAFCSGFEGMLLAVSIGWRSRWIILVILGWGTAVLYVLQRALKAWALYYVYRSGEEKNALAKALLSLIPVVPTVLLHRLSKRETLV